MPGKGHTHAYGQRPCRARMHRPTAHTQIGLCSVPYQISLLQSSVSRSAFFSICLAADLKLPTETGSPRRSGPAICNSRSQTRFRECRLQTASSKTSQIARFTGCHNPYDQAAACRASSLYCSSVPLLTGTSFHWLGSSECAKPAVAHGDEGRAPVDGPANHNVVHYLDVDYASGLNELAGDAEILR